MLIGITAPAGAWWRIEQQGLRPHMGHASTWHGDLARVGSTDRPFVQPSGPSRASSRTGGPAPCRTAARGRPLRSIRRREPCVALRVGGLALSHACTRQDSVSTEFRAFRTPIRAGVRSADRGTHRRNSRCTSRSRERRRAAPGRRRQAHRRYAGELLRRCRHDAQRPSGDAVGRRPREDPPAGDHASPEGVRAEVSSSAAANLRTAA